MTGGAGALVIADDLTGANATAAGFAREGLRAVTIGAHQDLGAVTQFAERFDVVVVSTDSRHKPAAQAGQLVRAIVRAGWPVTFVANRIDTTLRGNLGATTAAILDEVRSMSGQRVVALCAPAHPAAKRHTVDGQQLLDGTRLEHTELADDPHNPISHSDVARTLRAQADLRVANLPLSAVTRDDATLRATIADQLDQSAEVIVADALTTVHLDRVAAAAVQAGGADIRWISVDPGPGSVALGRALQLRSDDDAGPLLVVAGSATQLTRTQLLRLSTVRKARVVRMPFRDGTLDEEQASKALFAALDQATNDDIVVFASAISDDDVIRLGTTSAIELPARIATVVRRAIERYPVDGMFVTGGDVSAAVFAELGASGIHIETEIIPLAVGGSIVGGPWSELPVVTKGGLVGDADATVKCVDHLRRAADATRRHAPTAESRQRRPLDDDGGCGHAAVGLD